MNSLAITYEGTEEICKEEIEEILNKKIEESLNKEEPSVVKFSSEKEELFKLAYLGQSFVNVIQLIDEFDINEFEDIKKAKESNYEEFEGKEFRVTCLRFGEHNFNSSDVEKEVGGYILDKIKSKVNCKVNLNNPEKVLYIYIYNNKCYIGIDYHNMDLSKRDYNVHSHSKGINSILGFCMLKLGKYSKGMVLLDPLCLSGTIPLEAGYYVTKFSINYFRKNKFLFVKQKLVDEQFFKNIDTEFPKELQNIHAFDYEVKNITASKHNAKIGEIDKVINFRKVETDWIDLKFEEESVDLICTAPPTPNDRTLKLLKPRIRELFNNAEFVLKKGGRFVIKSNKLVEEMSKRTTLKLVEDKLIKKGKSSVCISVYEK